MAIRQQANPFDIVKRAMSTDKWRPILNTVMRHRTENGTFLIATDTHRLHIWQESKDAAETAENPTPLIPCEPGQYPNWQRVVPVVSEFMVARIPSKALRMALASLKPFGKESAERVRFTFTMVAVTISAKCDDCQASILIPLRETCNECMDGFEAAFNRSYIADVISDDSRETDIVMRFTDRNEGNRYNTAATRPAIFEVSGGSCDGFQAVIMPMQLS